MHVDNSPPVVAEAQGQRPRPVGGGTPFQDGPPKGGVSEVAKSMHGQTAPLSSESLGAAIAAQSEQGVATVADHGRSGESPAAQARALIEADPGLAERPFGQIVSALARGLEVAPASGGGVDPAPLAGDDGGSEPVVAVGSDGDETPVGDPEPDDGAVVADGDETPVGDPEPDDGAGESPDLAAGPDLVVPPPEVAVEEFLAEVLDEMLEDEEGADT